MSEPSKRVLSLVLLASCQALWAPPDAFAQSEVTLRADQSVVAREPSETGSYLGLREFLRIAVDSHPKIRAADSKVGAAEAAEMSARGNFDLKLEAGAGYAPLGKYEKSRVEAGLKQPTTVWGSELYLKYENGWDHPAYAGENVTSEYGKVSLGVLIPILRDGKIDDARLGIAQSSIEREIAEFERRQTQVDLIADAAALWWKWAILGQKRAVYGRLVEQAEERAEYLQDQLQVGAIAPIETVDNRRLILSRRAQLAQVELELRKLSLKLGLYRRNEQGNPKPARALELPPLPSNLPPRTALVETKQADIEGVPQTQIYNSAIDLLDRAIALAENQQLPRLDLRVGASHAAGEVRYYSATESTVSETAVGGTLSFSLDVQRRKARGKAAELRYKKSAILQDFRLFKDTMQAELDATAQALELQQLIAEQNLEATQLARTMVDAERESFEVGQSTIMNLNIREQAALSAELAQLDALLEYQFAHIQLQRLLGKSSPEAYLTSTTRLGDTTP